MKTVQLIKCCLIVAISSILMSCSQHDTSSPEHQNAIAWSQSIEQTYEQLKDSVQELEAENKTFSEVVWNEKVPD
ncbi:MAG: hypothetical protein AB8G86_06510, partial [Saprospiraceae bacterium]